MKDTFICKEFNVVQSKSTMKVNTDAILLGAWVNVTGSRKILDIGTGTGIIALMLAQRSDAEAKIDAVEIDHASAYEAEENFNSCPWNEKLKVFHHSVQDFSQNNIGQYDLVVSNPPFYTGGTFSDNENRNNVRHTVKLSPGDLLIAAGRLLSAKGRMAVILPFLEGERFIERAERMGFSQSRILEVQSKENLPIERLLIELVKEYKSKNVVREGLVLLKEGKDRIYTNDYKKLTSDFYTIF